MHQSEEKKSLPWPVVCAAAAALGLILPSLTASPHDTAPVLLQARPSGKQLFSLSSRRVQWAATPDSHPVHSKTFAIRTVPGNLGAAETPTARTQRSHSFPGLGVMEWSARTFSIWLAGLGAALMAIYTRSRSLLRSTLTAIVLEETPTENEVLVPLQPLATQPKPPPVETAVVKLDGVGVEESGNDLGRQMQRRALDAWQSIHRVVQELLSKPVRQNEEKVLAHLDSIALEQQQNVKEPDVVVLEDGIDEGDYAQLRGPFDAERLEAFFATRKLEVAVRVSEIVLAGLRAWRAWRSQDSLPLEKRTRGAILRQELVGLGPVFLKIGQTLSQRPDIIGEEAADALKSLQSRSPPFPSSVAFAIIARDLQWSGPIAPNVPHPGLETGAAPLFKWISPEPIASASLGQVYKAETWEGQQLAVKVQRPYSIRQVALDWVCWNRSLKVLSVLWNQETDLGVIADEVAVGVFNELRYEKEAAHAEEFNQLHGYLGYTRAPQCVRKYSGDLRNSRVLAMEWINGTAFRDLPKHRQLLMAEMAVEACVTQMLNTGFVHADPHEGNMLLSDEDELVFLDFGLVCRLKPDIMEGFAEGIQYMIAGNWEGLARVFQDVGFAPKDCFSKRSDDGWVKVEDAEFIAALQDSIESQEGGKSRFGALAVGLADLSTRYRLLTPPYIILLCRTFLTLEGMAATADPNFNIYQASLPYAVRRAMSPSTPAGIQALRNAWFTAQGGLQWDRIEPLIVAAESGPDTLEADSASHIMAERGALALSGLLGAPEGRAVRRMVHDVDTAKTIFEIAQHKAMCQLCANITTDVLRAYLFKPRTFLRRALPPAPTPPVAEAAEDDPTLTAREWYVSPEGLKIQEQQAHRKQKVIQLLVKSHLRRLARGGLRGNAALAVLGALLTSLLLQAVLRVSVGVTRDMVRAVLRSVLRRRPTRPALQPPVALSPA